MSSKEKVIDLLNDPEWSSRSTNWIAQEAGVSWEMVDRLREIKGNRPLQVKTKSGRMVRNRNRRNGK